VFKLVSVVSGNKNLVLFDKLLSEFGVHLHNTKGRDEIAVCVNRGSFESDMVTGAKDEDIVEMAILGNLVESRGCDTPGELIPCVRDDHGLNVVYPLRGNGFREQVLESCPQFRGVAWIELTCHGGLPVNCSGLLEGESDLTWKSQGKYEGER
jgi:hypothetical protein